MRVVVATDHDPGDLIDDLRAAEITVIAQCELDDLAAGASASESVSDALDEADVMILQLVRGILTTELVRRCDHHGVRIVGIDASPHEARDAVRVGLAEPLLRGADASAIVAAVRQTRLAETLPATDGSDRGRVIAVWGPAGAPGRSTIAAGIASMFARSGARSLLVDADTTAPSIALALGLNDDAPGFAAACRQAARGRLDASELARLTLAAPGSASGFEVLTGLNRIGRWPEVDGGRVHQVLDVCRTWADITVVDLSSSLERDEEIMSDIDSPRRHGATLSALQDADHVVTVASAEPVGIARFVRAHPDLRQVIGHTPVTVAVNRLRPGPLGIDARGQVRRTLERFASVHDAHFVPLDQRAADAAALAGLSVDEVSPRSPLARALRRLADALTAMDAAPTMTRSMLRRERAKRRSGQRRGERARARELAA